MEFASFLRAGAVCIGGLALAVVTASGAANASAPDASPPVKLSTSGVCHERGSRFYANTQNFTPFRTLDACLRAGGRLPVGVRPLSGAGAAPASPAEVVALVDALVGAAVKQDRAALEGLLDERFRATLADGRTIGRSAFIDIVMKRKPEPYRVVREVVELHGDAALVIGTLPGGSTKLTWIAVRKEGEWRVISETYTTVGVPAR